MSTITNNDRKVPALTNGDDIAVMNTDKGRAAVSSDILVALLITVVLVHKVEIVTTNNDGALHLGTNNNSSEDTSADGHITSEGALLVNVSAVNGFLRGLEAQTHILEPARSLALRHDALVVEEDGLLLLEATLGLSTVD